MAKNSYRKFHASVVKSLAQRTQEEKKNINMA
jgi:hypothetical protein